MTDRLVELIDAQPAAQVRSRAAENEDTLELCHDVDRQESRASHG